MYDYTNKGHLRDIASVLEGATTRQQALICAAALSAGWMRPRGIAMRVLWFVAKLRHRNGNGLIPLANSLLDKRVSEIRSEMWRQTLAWLVDGKDTSDSRSAGGWNACELAGFINFCIGVGALQQIPTE